ncbi:MAG: adenosylcobinamide-GDP ribazoletransferase [Campylobacterota bacterium]|nr:adenosylcobinamide-GDP ribazoletransferase [Campylobacterota bacterium]
MDYKQNSNSKISDTLNGIKYGVTYFTTLPIKLNYFEANKQFYHGVLLSLPIVGAVLSTIIILFYSVLPFHPIYSAVISSVLYLFLTGFLHYEAVGDTIDGWYASLTKKDVYEVMHEPQVGSIGAIGMISFMLLEISALVYCFYEGLFLVIFLAFVLSRVGVYFALSFEYHEKSQFILSLKQSIKESKVLNILFFPIKLFVSYILKKLEKKLGFLNGDTLGFLIVVLEIVLLNIGLFISLI